MNPRRPNPIKAIVGNMALQRALEDIVVRLGMTGHDVVLMLEKATLAPPTGEEYDEYVECLNGWIADAQARALKTSGFCTDQKINCPPDEAPPAP